MAVTARAADESGIGIVVGEQIRRLLTEPIENRAVFTPVVATAHPARIIAPHVAEVSTVSRRNRL